VLSVVVPCHDEEPVLPLLFDRLRAAALGWELEYEIICVDDGSTDRTWSLIEHASAADARVRGVRLARNFGQQAAIAAGLSFATGQAVVVMDADLQDPPEVVPELVKSWRAGHQVVHAVRIARQDRLVKRVLAAGFYRTLAAVVPFSVPRDAGEFVLLDRVVVDIMNALPEHGRYLRGLRAWCGFQQSEVFYRRDARAGGRPQYTFWKSLTLALDGVVSFSTAPLQLATYVGLTSLILGMVAVGWDVAAWTGAVHGPVISLTAVLVLGLGGINLICMGIVGEYIGRTAQQAKGRPLWIARDTAGFSTSGVFALYPTGASEPTRFPPTGASSVPSRQSARR
jgi:dolichol-phosphate mannosyltransferase